MIIQGDCLEKLKEMKSESVDLIITSPPYYGLRNYGVDGQIGLETTFEEFLEKMLKITAELRRVLKPRGQFWLNMGDCYASQPSGNKTISEANEGYDGVFVRKQKMGWGAKAFVDDLGRFGGNNNTSKLSNPDLVQNQGRARIYNYPEKCMLMQPERLAIAMIDKQKWILRNKIKWAKQVLIKKENRTIGSVMPSSVKDRFNESGEELYFFVKTKKYYSDLNAVRLPNQVIGVTEMREDGFTRSAQFNYDTKYKKTDYMPMSKQSNARKSLDDRMADTKNKNIKESRSYNMKKLLSEVRLGMKPNTGMERKISKTAEFFIAKGSGGNVNLPSEANDFGKNIPTIWQIQSEPHNFEKELGVEIDHFATFPQALLEIPIKFGCPKGGIVLDPFMGSGTTAVVAKKLCREFIGIELNPEYIKISQERLRATPVPLL